MSSAVLKNLQIATHLTATENPSAVSAGFSLDQDNEVQFRYESVGERIIMSKLRIKSSSPDYLLLAVIFLLVVFGLAMLASASSNLGKTQFNNSYYYLEHQIEFGLSLGVLGFLVAYFVPYSFWKKFAFPMLLLCIASLALVFTKLGAQINSTDRWLRLGPLSFQPAELVKLIILFISPRGFRTRG